MVGHARAVRAEIERGGLAVQLLESPESPVEAAHIFVTERRRARCELRLLLPLLDPVGFIWVSWPKQASKVPTDITEDVIRDVALPATAWSTSRCARSTKSGRG